MIFSRFSAYIRLALFLIAFVVTLWVQLSEHIESASTLEVIKLLIGFGLFVVISIIGAIAAIQDWYRKGRDWHWSKPRILDDSQDAKLRGIQPKEANVREFHPPENMSPVLMGLLLNDAIEYRDIMATYFDLARRGYATIHQVQSSGLPINDRNYYFHQTDKPLEDLPSYERLLLVKLFADKSQQSVRYIPNINEVIYQINQIAVEYGYYSERPDEVRRRSSRLAGLILVLAIFGLLFASQAIVSAIIYFPILGGIGLGIIMATLAKRLLAGSMPQKTALGFDMLRRIRGYQQFISEAPLHRQRFLDQPALLEEALPYGFIFNKVNELRKVSESMGEYSISWLVSTASNKTADQFDVINQAFESSIRHRE